MDKKYYFYVLLCSDKTLYGGFTTDLKVRTAKHNSGEGAKYTRNRRPVKLIYHEEFSDKSSALKAEYAFERSVSYQESGLSRQSRHKRRII